MKDPRSLPLRRLILFLSLAGMALFSAIRIVGYDPVPWGWVAAFATGTAILVGPIVWAARDRLSEERREHLGYVTGGIALLCVPVVLGLGLIFGNLLLFMDAGVLGGVLGFAAALLVEKTVMPGRLQGPTR